MNVISSHKSISEKDVDEVEKAAEALDDTKFERTCINMMVKSLKLLRECESKIVELSEKLEEVSGLLKKDKRLPTEDDNPSELDLFNDFPIKDDGMLANVELKLANGETYRKVLNNLIMIGGKDYKDCSRRLLQRILDDKFACGYSMQGHKKKKVFRSTKICACLLDAVQHCCKVSLKDIEVVVSTYLAKSPERLKRKGNSEPLEDIQEVNTQEVNNQDVENIQAVGNI